ncbi:hypothetical protein Dimus_035564 [Dionaea muscipula]
MTKGGEAVVARVRGDDGDRERKRSGCRACKDVKFTDGSFSGQLMMNMVNDEENVHQLQACINRRAWQQLAESLLGFFVVSNMEMNMVKQQLHVNFLDGSKAQIVAASFMVKQLAAPRMSSCMEQQLHVVYAHQT